MYAFIKGVVESVSENVMVVSNGGVGYEIFVSNSTLSEIGKIGEITKVFTYLHVREDAMILYGFSRMEEKDLFLKLITVSGIGAKTAITILSSISYSQLINAVVSGDVTILSSAKGVGKKTAERIILELKSKLGDISNLDLFTSGTILQEISSPQSEAVDLLMTMGLTKYDATELVKKVSTATDKTEEIIAKSLKNMR